ncbi:hypothetical protein [Halobacillus kuroshimensis]|nr:hypothetical protein [Halobacillus kuroshimensis]
MAEKKKGLRGLFSKSDKNCCHVDIEEVEEKETKENDSEEDREEDRQENA